jgi:hypothetical protein
MTDKGCEGCNTSRAAGNYTADDVRLCDKCYKEVAEANVRTPCLHLRVQKVYTPESLEPPVIVVTCTGCGSQRRSGESWCRHCGEVTKDGATHFCAVMTKGLKVTGNGRKG